MRCAKCKAKIKRRRPGGLLFSPPRGTLEKLGWTVVKHHLCPGCYKKVLSYIGA